MSDFIKNPLLANDIYICDVEARVFDGRLYLYGTTGDAPGKAGTYKEPGFRVYSTNDMINFTDHGIVFTASNIKWSEVRGLWAPDCAFYNGKYYMYYSLPAGEMGVAVADRPSGPFSDLGRVSGVHGIDPCVVIDDGEPYLFWGQMDNVRAAKLLPTMTGIDETTVTQPLTVAEHGFHEGSSIRKKDGKYYYVYTEKVRRKRATCQGHSISDSLLSGYKYSGVVVDVFDCDPWSVNNHGSIECFNGQWYIFYHRATHGVYNWGQPRQLCVEKICFDNEGVITEVIPTSSGAADTICASEEISAASTCAISGGAYNADVIGSRHYLALSKINHGVTATYRYLDFNLENTLTLRMQGQGVCRIELFVDGKYHSDKYFDLPMFFGEDKMSLPAIKGKHEITLRFYGLFSDAVLDSLRFSKEI